MLFNCVGLCVRVRVKGGGGLGFTLTPSSRLPPPAANDMDGDDDVTDEDIDTSEECFERGTDF